MDSKVVDIIIEQRNRYNDQRDLWSKACQLLFEAAQKGEVGFRPMDYYSEHDWAAITDAIDAAKSSY